MSLQCGDFPLTDGVEQDTACMMKAEFEEVMREVALQRVGFLGSMLLLIPMPRLLDLCGLRWRLRR